MKMEMKMKMKLMKMIKMMKMKKKTKTKTMMKMKMSMMMMKKICVDAFGGVSASQVHQKPDVEQLARKRRTCLVRGGLVQLRHGPSPTLQGLESPTFVLICLSKI